MNTKQEIKYIYETWLSTRTRNQSVHQCQMSIATTSIPWCIGMPISSMIDTTTVHRQLLHCNAIKKNIKTENIKTSIFFIA
jgi:hypothetical protein